MSTCLCHPQCFRLIKALEFSEEEAAEFWTEIDAAYGQDKAMQETASNQ